MTLPASFLSQPFAHRGLHTGSRTRPENSLSAFEAAAMFGFGIELDVQLTRDGTAIVFHDYDLQRLLNTTGSIQNTDLANVKAAQLLGSKEAPPTLQEVLDHVGGQVPILIELKDQSGTQTGTNGRLEKRVVEALTSYTGPVAVMSFNPDQMFEMRRTAPGIPRGVVTEAFVSDKWAVVPADRRTFLAQGDFILEVGASFITHKHTDLSNPLVARMKEAGLSVFCWTITSEGEAQNARRIVDNITFENYLPDA
ncbi:MAG: glycerophosphodiester phosphodiesterase family protein [Pseudomonadota bacterium]